MCVTSRRDLETTNEDGYAEWMKDLGVSSAKPVDNGRQL